MSIKAFNNRAFIVAGGFNGQILRFHIGWLGLLQSTRNELTDTVDVKKMTYKFTVKYRSE